MSLPGQQYTCIWVCGCTSRPLGLEGLGKVEAVSTISSGASRNAMYGLEWILYPYLLEDLHECLVLGLLEKLDEGC